MDTPASKEAVAVVWDVGAAMTARAADFYDCRDTVSEILLRNLIYHKQNEVGVYLLGAAETHNVLNTEHPGNYEHITLLSEIHRPTPDDIKKVEAVTADGGRMDGGMPEARVCGGGPSDFLDALIVANDGLERRCAGKKFRRTIYLFTDARGHVKQKAHLEHLREAMVANSVQLIVVGVAFKWDSAEAADRVDMDDCTEAQQNEKVVHWLINELNQEEQRKALVRESWVSNLRQAHDELTGGLKASAVLQRTAFRALFTVGDPKDAEADAAKKRAGCVALPLHAYLYTKAAALPSLRRVSARAAAGGAAGGGAAGDDGRVLIERQYISADDPEHVVEDKVKAYRYGTTPVPLPEVDEAALRFEGGPKMIRTLCFVSMQSVARHHLMSHTYCLVPPPRDAPAAAAFRAFVHAMWERESAAVVRVVRTDGAVPLMAVVWPRVKEDGWDPRQKTPHECLFLNELPFAEDLRDWAFPPQPAAGKDDLAAAEAVIKSMDLGEGPDEALRPRNTYNPALQTFHAAVGRRLLDPGAGVPPPGKRVRGRCCLFDSDDSVLRPMMAAARPAAERLRRACGVRMQEEKDESRKRAWFAGGRGKAALAAYDAATPAATPGGGASPAKRLRAPPGAGGGGGEADRYFRGGPAGASATPGQTPAPAPGAAPLLADGDVLASGFRAREVDPLLGLAAAGAPARRVGTVRPVDDFREMCDTHDGEQFQEAALQLCAVVRQLLRDSIKDLLYDKALDCVVALRARCVHELEPGLFNTFLRALRADAGAGRRRDWWESRVVRRGVTLVSAAEADADDAAPEDEARRFLDEIPGPPAAPPSPPAPDDEEDDIFRGMD